MINWEERIAQLYDWANTLDDEFMTNNEETVTIIRRILVELESTLLDDSEEAENKRKKLFASLRVIAEKLILRGCGDWILVETEQTSRSSGIISKADNKGKCLSTSKEYEYLVGNTVYFDNTGTKYQMIGTLTVVPFSKIYAYEVEE